ncbi:GAF domain-containing protein [Noviherbaspirillum sp.]|uniref:GAF domain-containing protein n=1 Tax=Noviherbaspirillum sp. TaxID=1926288 RepID=UPI002FE1878E
MKTTETKPVQKKIVASGLLMLGMAFMMPPALAADPLPPALQSKVDHYKQKMAEWAADPGIVAAVKEANAKGSLAGMSNSKWLEVDEKSPASQAFTTSKAGLLVRKWEEDKQVNKLVVRDEKGNLVAASTKPLLYNNAVRPVYINAMKGQPWSAGNIAPDPTTQVKSVQASVPVMDGGKVIGVMHAGITSE